MTIKASPPRRAGGCAPKWRDWVQQKVEMPKPKFDAQRLGDYISGCMNNGGAVTINLGIYQDGSVDPNAVSVLKEVRQRIRKEKQ